MLACFLLGLRLIECKLSATASTDVRAFAQLASVYGERNILSRTIITPRRGWRRAQDGHTLGDCIDWAELLGSGSSRER